MNDSFRTVAFLKYQPETVACACIYLAARKLQIPLPNNPHWFMLFNVTEEDIRDVCLQVLCLYTRPKADVDNLEKKVNEAKKIHVEAKRKLKGLASESATPNSRPVSPHKESPSAASIPAIKKIVSEDDHSDGSFGRDLEPSRRRKRGHTRSPSVSKSRSYSSSRSRSGSVEGDYRRYPSSKKHKHNSHHSKDRYTSNTSTSMSDKYSKDRYSSDKYYDKHIDKYSDRHSNDRYMEKDRYSLSNKHDPKYDAYNYRDYKEKEKSRDHKRSSGKHRDNSYSPVAERSPLHKKSYHRDRRHSRSRSPVDKHRSKKHASNGRSRSDRDRDRYSRR